MFGCCGSTSWSPLIRWRCPQTIDCRVNKRGSSFVGTDVLWKLYRHIRLSECACLLHCTRAISGCWFDYSSPHKRLCVYGCLWHGVRSMCGCRSVWVCVCVSFWGRSLRSEQAPMNALASTRAAAVREKIEVKWELMFLSNSTLTTTHPIQLSRDCSWWFPYTFAVMTWKGRMASIQRGKAV